MSEATIFSILTILLILLGVFMPYIIEASTGEIIDNDVSGLSGIEKDGVSYTEIVVSLIKAFFWVYGELGVFANAVKIMINFIWGYLLARLVRGGG